MIPEGGGATLFADFRDPYAAWSVRWANRFEHYSYCTSFSNDPSIALATNFVFSTFIGIEQFASHLSAKVLFQVIHLPTDMPLH